MSNPENIDMKVEEREELLIYNSNEMKDKRTLVYAESKERYLKTIDVSKEKITGTQLKELADKIGVGVKDMIDSKKFEDKKKEQFDEDQGLKLLANNLELLKTPILVKHNAAYFVDSEYNLIADANKLDRGVKGKISDVPQERRDKS